MVRSPISPSALARKILCSAYIPAPFDPSSRFRFLLLHAMATIKVIVRHLNSGYTLTGIERGGKGYRIDLLFTQTSSGKRRLDEVKSSRRIREVHRIQAALYADNVGVDEIAVSNRETDEVLSAWFIQEIRQRAMVVRQLLADDPGRAATTYTPHEDCCHVCGNSSCQYLSTMAGSMTAKLPE